MILYNAMRKLLLAATISLTAVATLCAAAPEWSQVPAILARIVAPTFPARDFDITKFGAVADGDEQRRQLECGAETGIGVAHP